MLFYQFSIILGEYTGAISDVSDRVRFCVFFFENALIHGVMHFCILLCFSFMPG